MGIFVNFSNHPVSLWEQKQRDVAEQYGQIVDVPFPNVSPSATERDIKKLGDEFVDKITNLLPEAVMCQGEFTLTYYVVKHLMDRGIVCVSACTERNVTERCESDGECVKESKFVFSGFRRYVQ